MARVSKYLNQMQVIEGVTFNTVSYFKGKVEVTARGYNGSTWMGTGTWKNAKVRTFTKRLKEFFTKITSTSLMVIKQRAKEILEKVEEVTTSAKEDLEAIKSIYSLKALKTMYRKLSKKYHPDMAGGDTEVFKKLNTIYTVKMEIMKEVTEVFAEFGVVEGDEEWVELVRETEEYKMAN